MSSPSRNSIRDTEEGNNNQMDNTAFDESGDTNMVQSSQKEENASSSSLVVEKIPNESFTFNESTNSSTSSQPLVSETEDTGYVPVEGPFYEGIDNRCQYAPPWYVPQPLTASGERSETSSSANDPSQQYRYQAGYPSGVCSPYYDPNMQGYIQNPYLFDYPGYLQTMWPHWQQQNYQRSDSSSQASSSTEVPSFHHGVGTTSPQSEGFRPQYFARPRRRYPPQQYMQSQLQEKAPKVKIADEPASDLSDSEKEDYQLFKEIFNKGESLETLSLEQKEVFERVVHEYVRYAGIPENVDYRLGEYDGKELLPRQKPSPVVTLADDLELRKQQVRDKAKEFAAYYQSCEWDRTNGWDIHERVTLLDIESLKIGQPEDLVSDIPQSCVPTMYVVLIHQLPKEKIPKLVDGAPVPCCETYGDLLETIVGKGNCKTRCTLPTLINHKWYGEFSLCGYKKDHATGRTVPKVFRGRQDVGAVYETIYSNERKKKERTNRSSQ